MKSVCVCVNVCADNNVRRYRNGEVIFVRDNFRRFVFAFVLALAGVAFAFAMFGGL